MKKTDSFIYAILYALYIFAACLVARAFDWLATKVVNLFVEVPYFGLSVIRIVIYTLLTLGIIFVLAFREGYKEVSFSLPVTVIAAVIAFVPYFTVSLIFKFPAILSGGVRYIAAALRYGTGLTRPEQIDALNIWYFIFAFVAMWVVYFALIAVAKKQGYKKRLSDRMELTDGKIDDEGNYRYEE